MRWVKTSQLWKEQKRKTEGLGKITKEKISQSRKEQEGNTGEMDG